MAAFGTGYVEEVGNFAVFADEKHKLGSGATGIVYLAMNTATEEQAAAKKMTIEVEFLLDGDFEKEADLLLNKIPEHDNIVKLYEFTKHTYTEDETKLMDMWLIMEYCPLGNLKKYARSTDLTVTDKLDLMYQAALAVDHLHNCKPEPVVHRDIKPENILISGKKDNPKVKLCDFGASKLVEHNAQNKSLFMQSVVGTRPYWAPEQQPVSSEESGNEVVLSYTKSVDTFSLGISNLALLEASKGTTMQAKMSEYWPLTDLSKQT